MVVRRTGSSMKRPGTDALDVGDGFGDGQTIRKFPFYYDNGLSFVLLVTNTTVRVFQASPEFAFDRDFTWSGWTDAEVAAMRVKQVGDTLFCSTTGKTTIRMIRAASDGSWSTAAEIISSPPDYSIASSLFTVSLVNMTSSGRTAYYGVWAQNDSGQLTNLIYNFAVTMAATWPAGGIVRWTVPAAQCANIPEAAIGDTWVLCKKYAGYYGRIGSHEITAADRASTADIVFYETTISFHRSHRHANHIREGDDDGGYAWSTFTSNAKSWRAIRSRPGRSGFRDWPTSTHGRQTSRRRRGSFPRDNPAMRASEINI
jgi:hypothetical protein